jgi:integrase
VATGRLEHDPSAALKPREIFRKCETRHHAAITDPKELAPLLFVRPGELQKMEWSELDLEAALWSIQADRMKMNLPHVVPLAKQALKIFKALMPVTGAGRYVFPGRTSSRPMSNNSINAALRYLGYDRDIVTGHGFRATARTILDEVLGFRVDLIEHQLAHAVRDPNGGAYNRTSFIDDRRLMMQRWADYLDNLKTGV